MNEKEKYEKKESLLIFTEILEKKFFLVVFLFVVWKHKKLNIIISLRRCPFTLKLQARHTTKIS